MPLVSLVYTTGIVDVGMPGELHRPSEVQVLVDDGAQLVEVLPREEYEELHLPGAISIPLRKVDTEARQRLDATRAVVVYCWDSA
jgi:rhodanese-related sulfurtransferase